MDLTPSVLAPVVRLHRHIGRVEGTICQKTAADVRVLEWEATTFWGCMPNLHRAGRGSSWLSGEISRHVPKLLGVQLVLSGMLAGCSAITATLVADGWLHLIVG